MAEPIVFTPPPRDPRQTHIHQLEKAPEQHAEALLDAYAILQLLRDKGLLELAKGALGSGEKVLTMLTETMESEEVVRTIRNLVIFIKIIGALEPDVLDKILKSLTEGIIDAKVKKPPGLLHLVGRMASPDSRRALVPVVAALEAFGKNLDVATLGDDHKGKRKLTTRHSA